MQRLLYIDTLRGIASLMVLIFHCILFLDKEPTQDTIEYWLTNFFDLGKIGIVIFFAISGFVISWSLSSKNSLSLFWRSRILRLYPAYWISIIFALIFGGDFLWSNIDYLTIIMNLTMLQQYFGFQNILGVYWTLSIEMVFYITISTIYILNYYNNKSFYVTSILFLAIAFILAIARYILDIKLPVALPLALSVMFFSALLQKVIIENDTVTRNYIRHYLVLFVIIIPIISLLAYNKNMGYHEVWYRYTISYFSALFIFISMVSWLKFTNIIGVFIGKISYSIYLFHPIVMVSNKILLTDIYNSYGLFGAVILLMILTIIIATVIYYTVEKPFIKLSKRYFIVRN